MDSRLRSAAGNALGAIAFLVALLLCAAPAEARVFGRRFDAPVVQPQARPAIPRPREDRIVELPEDGEKWHLTVAGDTTAAATIKWQIEAAPRLTHLSGQVITHFYTPDFWWVKGYLQEDPKPVVMLQDRTGRIVYKASGADVPASAEELADEIEASVLAYNENCPDCEPPPDAKPTTFTRPAKRMPDVRPEGGMGTETVMGLGLIAAAVLIAWFFRSK